MKALEFLKETSRMCSSYGECTDCPLKELASFSGYETCRVAMLNECEKAISAVDAWSKEHPIITNAQKFEEVFGFAPEGEFTYFRFTKIAPNNCIKMHWDAPYEEPKRVGNNG